MTTTIIIFVSLFFIFLAAYVGYLFGVLVGKRLSFDKITKLEEEAQWRMGHNWELAKELDEVKDELSSLKSSK